MIQGLSVLQKIQYIIIALLGINLIIGVHEAGHYLMCKTFDIHTPEFSLGFGPLLISHTINKTQFSLRALPIGGYVQIAGMNEAQEDSNNFANRPYHQKALVTLGGIAFNILFGVGVFQFVSPREFGRRLREKTQIERGFIGPIGIISLLMQTAAASGYLFWGFLAMLSVNLAVINALPLPFLDGGHFVTYTLHAVNQSFSIQELRLALLLAAVFISIVYIIYNATTRRL